MHFSDKRRLNVAITRAKKQLTVICDTETVGSDRLLAEFLQYLKGSRKKKRAYIRRPGPGDVHWPLLKGTKYVGSPSKFDWSSFHANEEEIDRSKIVGQYIRIRSLHKQNLLFFFLCSYRL